MNKIIVMGRIVNAPELKVTPNGVNVCTFRIAVDRKFQAKGEEKKTDFFNVTAWRATAEFVAKYFAKGRMILVEGEMQTRPYTDKNGNQATWYEIVVSDVYFTGEKKDSETPPASQSPAEVKNTAPQAAQQAAAVTDGNDYPF